ncbi:hypothetical protein ACFFQW_34125 [Umezawaea endophytica]|uniref:5-bromo-4-chloroindolyl phosphate hydrolysis protein n=1 Tax=Umezawaea endophytica TaxID=1654476 RepID=A0A9X3AJC1_9PSEU|nr:hypothetical protein [Umezawaea endophytica]MCS7484367.1 hypothetical protein [Umezawaea endophytica]
MARSVLAGLAIGIAVMFTLFTLLLLTPSSYEGSIAASLFASLFVAIPTGGIPGTLLGLLVGAIRKSNQRALPPPPPPVHARPLYVPATPADQWSKVVARCEESVRRVVAVVDTVPASPAKEWMARIAAQFEAELEDVRGIARLARAMGAVDENHPASQRLFAAARDFAAFETEVGRVALKMFDRPELDRARTDLEFLEQQLPSLGA